jgi:hypothetical protein
MDQTTFAEELKKAMRSIEIGSTRLSQAIGNNDEIPARTINGWLDGKRPRKWEAILQVAAALGCDRETTNLWLALNKYHSLEQLAQQHPLTDKQRILIQICIDIKKIDNHCNENEYQTPISVESNDNTSINDENKTNADNGGFLTLPSLASMVMVRCPKMQMEAFLNIIIQFCLYA